MCGFYFSNRHPETDWTFADVTQRGFKSATFTGDDYFAIQSVLPCVNNIDFTLYDTPSYLFLYTGEIYNYNRTYNSDTEMMLDDLMNNRSISSYNGMYAYVLYDKKKKEIKYGRDKTGQIPLFVYNKNGHIVISNTVKSIVKTTDTSINYNSLDLWKTSKHFIFKETPWNDIYSVTPASTESCYSNLTVEQAFTDMQHEYTSALPSASINSGGIDSSIVSKWFGNFQIAINHIGKDFVSNHLDFAIDISEQQWCEYVDQFIEETYLFPYTWSWIGYYIIGKKLKGKFNILYTGEGADEIFGGYPDYQKGIRTPYSKPFIVDKNNLLISNKACDQKYFIPTAAMGANIALGCSTIEPRSPFLDRRIMNNQDFLYEDNKQTLREYYTHLYNIEPAPKQGFGGFPDEYGKNLTWKDACFNMLATKA